MDGIPKLTLNFKLPTKLNLVNQEGENPHKRPSKSKIKYSTKELFVIPITSRSGVSAEDSRALGPGEMACEPLGECVCAT